MIKLSPRGEFYIDVSTTVPRLLPAVPLVCQNDKVESSRSVLYRYQHDSPQAASRCSRTRHYISLGINKINYIKSTNKVTQTLSQILGKLLPTPHNLLMHLTFISSILDLATKIYWKLVTTLIVF